MDAVLLFLVLILGLAALDGASLTWGADTREQYPDDHTHRSQPGPFTGPFNRRGDLP